MANTRSGVAEPAPRCGMLSLPSSRRAALTRVGAGGLGAVLAGRCLGLFAQEATPDAWPSPLDAWLDAWTLDPTGADGLYTTDAVLEDTLGGVELHGPSEIRAHIDGDFAAVSDRTAEVRTVFVAGSLAATEMVFSGTYTGTYPGLPPSNGQAVSLRIAAIFEVARGRIRRDAHYYDAYACLVQTGALPAPGTESTPTE